MNMPTFCHTCHPQSWYWSCHCIQISYSHCPQTSLNLSSPVTVNTEKLVALESQWCF